MELWNESIAPCLLHSGSTIHVIYFNRLSEGAARPFSNTLCTGFSNNLAAGKLAQLTDPKQKELFQISFKASIVHGFNT